MGARNSAPEQQSGSAAGRSHLASTEDTSAVAGGAAEDLEPPEVPGAVEPETTYPDVSLPSVSDFEQDAEISVVETPIAGFVEGESVELTSMRQPTSQVFQNPDGTRTLRAYDDVAFMPDPQLQALARQGVALDDGELLLPVDPTLGTQPDGRLAPVRALPVSFGAQATDTELARIELGNDRRVAFGLDSATGTDPVVDGSTVTYPDVRDDADIRFTVSSSGLKEEIVLRTPDAPTSWVFPLEVEGVTPSLDEAGRVVTFTDSSGNVHGYIPPGYMMDSNIHPRRGDGEVSHDVSYELVRDGGGWALRVELDEEWLRHPAREFPVYVDPSYQRNADSDDTFVSSRDYANQDNSWRNEIKVGTYDGGGNKAASYLDFRGLLDARRNRYVHGATLNVYNHWSYSCDARPVSLYKVTKSWSGSTTKKWAGPSYGTRLDRRSFAYGYHGCPQGGWGVFTLGADRMMRWLHRTEGFYGLTLRASSTDSKGWKRFWSSDYGTSSGRPYIDLNYSDQGAKYSLPSGVFNPPVTGASAGKITVRVKNWGMSTWTPTNGYRLRVRIYTPGGSLVQSVPFISMPRNVGPHKSVDIPVEVQALDPGNYNMRIYMVTPDTVSFQNAYNVPYAQAGFTVSNGPPTIVGNWPAHNGYVDTLTPHVWGDYYDPDNFPADADAEYRYRVCEGAPDGGGACQNSGWITSSTWQVPDGVAEWNEPTHWYLRVSDTSNSSSEIGPFVFTPVVAQPPVTSNLAGAPADADVPGLNPLVGNYSTTVTDASVSAVGPPLEITRTYNSQDLRTTGAFGAGWSSPIDQRVEEDADGSGNVVVTLASGRQLRFGRNLDGTYTPPPGANLTLVRQNWASSTWILRDAAGTKRVFDSEGRLRSITDSDDHTQFYTYVDGTLQRIRDSVSGRGLNLTWTGTLLRYVETDPPGGGQPGPRWTYSYTDGLLTEVCTPLSAGSCTTYEYEESSHHRSVVLDDNPAAYWPLNESDGTTAANVAAAPDDRDATYLGDITLGLPGALNGSPDTAISTNGGGGESGVSLPVDTVNAETGYAVELWFKQEPDEEGGILWSTQTGGLGETSGRIATLSTNESGKLRFLYQEDGSAGFVLMQTELDDGVWHHIVLTFTPGSNLQVFRDGVWVTEVPNYFFNGRYSYVGNGSTGGGREFGGSIDDVAYYRHPLSASQVAAHHAAASTSHRLVAVVKPGEFVAAEIDYDHATGRVASMTDRYGEVWGLSELTGGGTEQAVVLSSEGAGSFTFTYDMEHAGRLVSRADMFGEESWEYNSSGFVSKAVDSNGNATTFATDERGNVVGRATCREPEDCATEYFGYFLNESDPLDPRNDVMIWEADARSSSASDTTYRTTYDIDADGRVAQTTRPIPYGHSVAPTETFTYSTGGPNVPPFDVHEEARDFIEVDGSVVPIVGTEDEVEVALSFPIELNGDTFTSAWISTWGEVYFESAHSWVDMCVLCHYWNVDASASVRTAVLGSEPDRKFVVEWRNVAHPNGMRYSMQVVIAEGGEVSFNYADHGQVGHIPGVVRIVRSGWEGFIRPEWEPQLVGDASVSFVPTPDASTYDKVVASDPFVPAGTVLPLSGDDELLEIDLPFPMTLYGETYSNAWVSTNGFASLLETACGCPNGSIVPDVGEPNAAVYPLWADLVVDSASSVRTEIVGSAPERTFIIEWRNVHAWGQHSARGSFEVLLSENGDISFHYSDAEDLLAHTSSLPVVGVEDETGSSAVDYRAALGAADGVAYVFTPTPGVPPEGLLTESTASNGGVATYEYNPGGDLVRTEDPVGLVEEYTYDGLGRVTSVTSSSEDGSYGTTTYTYNELSQVETATAPAVTNPVTGATHTELTTHTYDDAGRRTSTTISDATGGDTARTWDWDYDAAGRLISTTAPDGGTTTQEWDTRGDVVQVTEPGGLVLEHSYDGAHRRIETAAVGEGIDPLDPSATRLVLESRSYDPGGRLASTVDAMGQETAYSYYGDNLPASVFRVRRDEDDNITSTHLLHGFEYNDAGILTSWTTAGGATTQYHYDPAGYLDAEWFDSEALDRWTVYWRNLDGTVNTVEVNGAGSPSRWETRGYTYDVAGRVLTETVDNTGGTPDSLTTTYERDPRGLVTQETDPSGVGTWFGYDDLGRVETVTGESRNVWTNGTFTEDVQPVTTFGRNAFGEVTHERDRSGAVIRLALDQMGRSTGLHLPEYTPPGGESIQAVEHTEYDERGLPVTETDPLGRVTQYEYDVYGRLQSRTLPDPDGDGPQEPPVWSYGYDRLGQLLEATDPTGGQVLATYDDLGRQVTETVTDRTTGSTLYLTTEYGYDDAGNRTTVTTPLGLTTTATYNAAGEPTRVTDPSGRFTEYRYDGVGRVVESVNGRNGSYTNPIRGYGYDLAGRQIGEGECTVTSGGDCDEVLREVSRGYDAAGRLTNTTSPEGRVTHYGYDSAGQLTSITQPTDASDPDSGVTVELGYDANGRRSRMVDGNGNETIYTYTSWSLPESVIEPATTAHPGAADRTWTIGYDAAGQPVQEFLPGGVARTATYDGLGNLTSETGAGAEASTATREIGYDALGRVTSINRADGDTTYTWDDRGLLVGSSGAAGNATFEYDGDGRLVLRTDVAGTATFTYNQMGAVATASDPLTGRTASYTYADSGAVETVAWSGGGATREYTYDDLGRVTADEWLRPDETVAASATYTYDDDNLVIAKTTTGVTGAGANEYDYDGLGRLVAWTRPDDEVITYGYDEASNRTTVDGPDGLRTATFDERNRLVSATGGGEPDLTQTWTARGTLATSTEGTDLTSYAFDAFERLVQVAGPTSTTDYTYDALDRVATSGGTPHLYAGLANSPVRVPAAGGADALVVRTPGGAPLSGQVGTGPGRVLLSDMVHGDLVAAADPGTGELPSSATYHPYGEVAQASGELPLGYQGGWTDPDTGQVNAHARWYDPGAGAFTSRDTWTLQPDPVAQSNRYLYGNGNPITNFDPTGHTADAIELTIPTIIIGAGACAVGCIVTGVVVAGTLIWVVQVAGAYYVGSYVGTKVAEFINELRAGRALLHPIPRGGSPGLQTGTQPAPPITNGLGAAPAAAPAPTAAAPPVSIPAVAPRPATAPTQRPTRVDPTGGQGISNTVPRSLTQPRVTTDSGGGTAPGVTPPGTPAGPPPGLPGPAVQILRAISRLADTTAPEEFAQVFGTIVRTEEDDRNDCGIGEKPNNWADYYPPDHLGRAVGGEICLEGGTYPGDTYPGDKRPPRSNLSNTIPVDIPGYDGEIHDKSHLIASELGGSSLHRENIVLLNWCVNQITMREIEKRVRRQVTQQGETIFYRVTASYTDDSNLASEIRITAIGDQNTRIFNEPIPNTECKGGRR